MKNEKIKSFSKIAFKKEGEPCFNGKKETNSRDNAFFSKIIDWMIDFPIYLAIALLPFFFWQNVPSSFELNKQMLLVFLVGISALSWIGKMAWRNEIRVRKGFILIPFLTFLLIYSLSTIFSSYYEQSMWGYFGGENKSLVSVLFFVAFFILIYNNVRNYSSIAKLVFVFLFSGALLVLFSILQFFEVYLLPFDFAKEKFFNPVGSVYMLAVYSTAVFLVAVSLFLSNISKFIKLFLIILIFSSFFVLMLVNFNILWMILIIILAFILGMTSLIEGKEPSQSRIVPMIFLVLVLFFVIRSRPIINNNLPVEIFLNYKISSKITLNSIKSNPLLGSGPTTFANVYKINRPSDLGDFSVVNFNESASFFTTLASTTGILGTLSFLFLVIAGLFVLFKENVGAILKSKSKNNFNSYLGLSIGSVWLFLTVFLFLYFVNMTILMLWFLFFGLMVSFSFFNKQEKDGDSREIKTTSSSPKTSFLLSFGFVLVIIGFIAVIYLQGQKYLAAVYFNQALAASTKADNVEETAEKMAKAVSLDPNRDSYYRDLAVVHLALAKNKIIEKGIENLTPEESNYVSTRFRSALQSLNQAKTLNPANSLNFVSVANLYEEFIVIQKDSGDRAIENYQKAIELDPRNPDIYQSMANVNIILADLEAIENRSSGGASGEEAKPSQKTLEYLATAEDYLKKALEIKADHVGANVLLVSVYGKRGDLSKTIEKAEENVRIFPNSPELLMDLGGIYYQQEKFDEAEKVLRQALSMNNQYANARYMLGLVLFRKGEKDVALKEFEKISESNPDNELLKKIIDNLRSGRDVFYGTDSSQTQEPINQEIEENIEQIEREIENESPVVDQKQGPEEAPQE